MEKVTLDEALEWVGEYSKPERFADIRRHLDPAWIERIRSTNTVADAGDGGCYLVWGCWSSKPRDARLKTLASSRC
jgi:hypothetical protein